MHFKFPPRSFIVIHADRPADAIVAPPGYSLRYSDGTVYRDGGPVTAGPEHGPRAHAFRFRSHRAAARVASGVPYFRIVAVDLPPSARTR
jgi:hypothetical protein